MVAQRAIRDRYRRLSYHFCWRARFCRLAGGLWRPRTGPPGRHATGAELHNQVTGWPRPERGPPTPHCRRARPGSKRRQRSCSPTPEVSPTWRRRSTSASCSRTVRRPAKVTHADMAAEPPPTSSSSRTHRGAPTGRTAADRSPLTQIDERHSAQAAPPPHGCPPQPPTRLSGGTHHEDRPRRHGHRTRYRPDRGGVTAKSTHAGMATTATTDQAERRHPGRDHPRRYGCPPRPPLTEAVAPSTAWPPSSPHSARASSGKHHPDRGNAPREALAVGMDQRPARPRRARTYSPRGTTGGSPHVSGDGLELHLRRPGGGTLRSRVPQEKIAPARPRPDTDFALLGVPLLSTARPQGLSPAVDNSGWSFCTDVDGAWGNRCGQTHTVTKMPTGCGRVWISC